MLTVTEARDIAVGLARAATAGSPEEWRSRAAWLAGCEGRTWLALDDVARSYTYMGGTPVGGTAGWLGASLGEPTGFVAAVTSLHADGRIRQRATRVLAEGSGTLRATALAVRTLDHVVQVRDEALTGLIRRLDADTAEAVLGVLLAGARRSHAGRAIETVQAALQADAGFPQILERLMGSNQRAVRRWAFGVARDHHLLTVEAMVGVVASDPDQWLRATCAGWLRGLATRQDLQRLLAARSVDARLVALTYLDDDDLPTETFLALLADRAPRIRGAAQWRARRRGVDVTAWYRHQLSQAGPAVRPGHLGACLDGLRAIGGPEDLALFIDNLDHPSPNVRRAAVEGIGAFAEPTQILSRLVPVLLDTSPAVCSAAARALVRAGAGPTYTEAAWTSAQPWSRRAAWRIVRTTSSWNRVEADLRAAADSDGHLADLGRAGIRNWLTFGAATTWAPLDEAQRQRIRLLLSGQPIDERQCQAVAFHAGIKLDTPPLTVAPDPPPPATSGPRKGRVMRFLRRRR